VPSKPQIIFGGDVAGLHNLSEDTNGRLERGGMYRDQSTVVVIPTRGQISARVVESWWNLMAPMNHPLIRLFVEGMEVGAAYNAAVEMILSHPQLAQFRYMLTLEEDNLPPPDGLLTLLESIDGHAAVGGLYFTKGPGGQPMIYGKPGSVPMFAPQVPEREAVMECNGLGQGFTLFDLEVFKDMDAPWFETIQDWSPATGARAGTQDLVFFGKLREAGHKVACDTRVRVGHIDGNGTVW
jgi:hypothetical protein